MKPATLEAYRLMHEGALAFSKIESAGMRIDTDYLQQAKADVDQQLADILSELKQQEVYQVWKQHYGRKMNLDSGKQLGKILFDVLKMPCTQFTSSHQPSTDESHLTMLDDPFIDLYLEQAKLQKLRGTYLNGIERELCDGRIHFSLCLHTTKTYRSCVAKGTLIEVVRDVSKYPKGIPIEDVKQGDYVYCYDDDLNLVLRRVKWAGKTGHRKVVRLHWSARGKHGHLDVTPEHKIRLASGKYVQARRLTAGQDFRLPSDSKYAAKIRTLAMGRVGDRIFQTGQSKAILDHRFVYGYFKGSLVDDDVIHHRDGNHLNNTPSNLEKHTRSSHGRIHATDERFCRGSLAQNKAQVTLKAMRDSGLIRPRHGKANPSWIDLSKFQMLRLLAKAAGRPTKVPYDFSCFKRKSEVVGIDCFEVRKRYDRFGIYISRGRLKSVYEQGGIQAVQDVFGVGYYRCLYLLKINGIEASRRWGNQFGSFVPNNHKITSIEYLDSSVDVYDLEVEQYHNFIANEICVHNSATDPNIQNIPVRNQKISKIIRSAFIPRKGRVLIEFDYSQIEVRVAACYHQDPRMLKYIQNGYDFHSELARQLYFLEPDEVNKGTRGTAKGAFVFAEFYGDYYLNVARNLWDAIDRHKLTCGDVPLKAHLKSKGIKRLGELDLQAGPQKGSFIDHVRAIETDFWEKRFRVYGEWRRRWWDQYQDRGYMRTKTGFVVSGLSKRNEVINSPIQGSAFHCLLWSLIQIQKKLRRYKLKSIIIGQIHDSLIMDVVKSEVRQVCQIVRETMVDDLIRHWSWIITPIEIEAEIGERNWYEKKKLPLE